MNPAGIPHAGTKGLPGGSGGLGLQRGVGWTEGGSVRGHFAESLDNFVGLLVS